jgi:hypothetical protein
MLQMALQRLKQLAAHEIGHTLGLCILYFKRTGPSKCNGLSATNGNLKVKWNDLSTAYTNEIGDWDKLSIQYGYEQFPQETNETAALDKLLTDASKCLLL